MRSYIGSEEVDALFTHSKVLMAETRASNLPDENRNVLVPIDNAIVTSGQHRSKQPQKPVSTVIFEGNENLPQKLLQSLSLYPDADIQTPLSLKMSAHAEIEHQGPRHYNSLNYTIDRQRDTTRQPASLLCDKVPGIKDIFGLDGDPLESFLESCEKDNNLQEDLEFLKRINLSSEGTESAQRTRLSNDSTDNAASYCHGTSMVDRRRFSSPEIRRGRYDISRENEDDDEGLFPSILIPAPKSPLWQRLPVSESKSPVFPRKASLASLGHVPKLSLGPGVGRTFQSWRSGSWRAKEKLGQVSRTLSRSKSLLRSATKQEVSATSFPFMMSEECCQCLAPDCLYSGNLLQRYESIVEQKNILGSSNGDDESPSPLKTVHVKWRISFCLLQKSRPLLTLHSQNPHSSSCTRKGRGENSKQTMAPVKIHMKSSVITRLPDSVYSKPGCFTIQSMTREKKEERQVCMSSNVNKWMECFRLAGASINHIFVAGWLLIYLTSEEKQKLPRRHRKDKVQYRAVKSTSWRRHFCVLDIQHGLMCFTNKPSLYETKRFDSLELPPPALYFDELLCARARAIEDEAYSKPFCILLESAKFHGRDGIVLMAQNDHDRERWLQAVKEFHESPLR